MPALHLHLPRLALERHLLQARKHPHEEVQHREPRGLSPAAVGLLVPVFIVFVFGPFLCILLVRKRRRTRGQRHIPQRLNGAAPAIKREDARKTLEGVTHISTIAVVDEKRECVGVVAEKEVVASDDRSSLMERDCAICLSTLHAPSPPEPAKLSSSEPNNTNNIIASSRPPSVANLSMAAEKEEILRLKVCTHEFHAECLISWFCIRKYSCPICRAVYYKKEEGEDESRVDESGQLETQTVEGDATARSQQA